MRRPLAVLRHAAEFVAAMLMAAMFLTFVLQIVVRYTARVPAIAEAAPFLQPALYGWTLEFCLALWVWLVFFGCAFVVRDTDHVAFDLVQQAVGPRTRRAFAIIAGLAIAIGFAAAIEPTWDKSHILRLKKTATLSALFGDAIRMRHVYAIFIAFLAAVSVRYAWATWRAIRGDVDTALPPGHDAAHRTDE